MPRDDLLLGEMIEAAKRAVEIVDRLDPDDPTSDRDLLDALLWNYTVLGEAARSVSDDVKEVHPEVPWCALCDCAIGSSTATGPSISTS